MASSTASVLDIRAGVELYRGEAVVDVDIEFDRSSCNHSLLVYNDA